MRTTNVLFGAIIGGCTVAPVARSDAEITRAAITNGGGRATSFTYIVTATVGQSTVTFASSDRYCVQGGITFGAEAICCDAADDCRYDPRNNACNQMTCVADGCMYACVKYGDVKAPPDGLINLDDILCVLAGFGNFVVCPDSDIRPCGANGIINLDDILGVLGAFAGANSCGCDTGAAAPLCGSSSP